MKRRVFLTATLVAVAAAALPSASLAGGGQSVPVNLSEFKITGSKLRSASFGQASALRPGPTTFTFRNRGQFPHNFVIVSTSKGARKFGTPMIGPGASTTLRVNLRPGAYLAVCTVGNGLHYSQGMVRPFTVGTQDMSTLNWGP
jgi:hypothetical protein